MDGRKGFEMKHLDQVDIDCLIEMRNACAACFRVIADNDLDFSLAFQLRKSGIKDGFGVRFQELIDRQISNEYIKFVVEDKLNENP